MPWILAGAAGLLAMTLVGVGALVLAIWPRSSPDVAPVTTVVKAQVTAFKPIASVSSKKPAAVATDTTRDIVRPELLVVPQPPVKSEQPAKPSEQLAKPPEQPAKAEQPVKLSGQEVYERVLKSTVWINNPSLGSGTGVLINAQEKLVLTNFHVVARGTVGSEKILQVFKDKLANTDPLDKNSKRFKTFPFSFQRAGQYHIDLQSKDFHGYLEILDAAGKVLASDSNSGGEFNAWIRNFTPPADGKYRIVAKTFDGKLGDFTLVVSQISSKAPAGAAPALVPASVLTAHFPSFVDDRVVTDKKHYLNQSKTSTETFKAEVLAYSEAKDLAVLRLSNVPAGIVALPLAKESGRPGQAVHSIGNPGRSGAMWVYTSGTVRTAPYHKQWEASGGGMKFSLDALVIETQSPTNPGDSGGPLVNEFAELVAVTQGSSVGANAINLFIDVGDVRGFLKAKGIQWVEK
ncbi:MAG TPA: serine protease [Gemmataceae bacterium]|nr:serine protease [Gemmataceae bacterium]